MTPACPPTAVEAMQALGLLPLLDAWLDDREPRLVQATVSRDDLAEVRLQLELTGADFLVVTLAKMPLAWFVSSEKFDRAILRLTPASCLKRVSPREAAGTMLALVEDDGVARVELSERWCPSGVQGRQGG